MTERSASSPVKPPMPGVKAATRSGPTGAKPDSPAANALGVGRVLLVEDDVGVREAVAALMRHHGFHVTALADGRGFIDAVTREAPHVVVLDVYLPDSTGFELAQQVRERSTVPILFLTAAGELESRLHGFAVGADDYLVKPFAPPELLARLRVLVRRSAGDASPGISVRDLVIDEATHSASRANHRLSLTPTEFNLLWVLCAEPGRVFSKIQLLSRVWDFEHYDTNLVEVHISSLRRKLEEHGPRMIHTEWGRGYVVVP